MKDMLTTSCILRIDAHNNRNTEAKTTDNIFNQTKREKRVKQTEKEKKNSEKCLRRKLEWIGKKEESIISEQLTVLPHAIVQGFAEPLQHCIRPQRSVPSLYGRFRAHCFPYKEVTEI